jgi:hypothetical protein
MSFHDCYLQQTSICYQKTLDKPNTLCMLGIVHEPYLSRDVESEDHSVVIATMIFQGLSLQLLRVPQRRQGSNEVTSTKVNTERMWGYSLIDKRHVVSKCIVLI